MEYQARRAQQTPWRRRLRALSRPLAPGLASAALLCGVALAAVPTGDAPGADLAGHGADSGRAATAADRPLLELGGTAHEDSTGRNERPDRSRGRTAPGPDVKQKDSSKKDADKKDADKESKKVPESEKAPKSKGSGNAELNVKVLPKPKPKTESKSDSSGGNSGGTSSNNDSSNNDSSGNGSGSNGSGGTSGSTQACSSGSSVEQGLTANAIKVHRDVCHRWPQLTNYGGVRPDSMPEHPSGRALDIMISNNATGWEVAQYLRANAGRLGISQVIFDQKIWTVQRSGEGWRGMSDRGGATANHRDHVHVTVYG